MTTHVLEPTTPLCADCRETEMITTTESTQLAVENGEKDTARYRTYSLTREEFNSLYAISAGRCYICLGAEASLGGKLAIDHDHSKKGSEAVRGLLCTSCNVRVGKVESLDGFEVSSQLSSDMIERWAWKRRARVYLSESSIQGRFVACSIMSADEPNAIGKELRRRIGQSIDALLKEVLTELVTLRGLIPGPPTLPRFENKSLCRELIDKILNGEPFQKDSIHCRRPECSEVVTNERRRHLRLAPEFDLFTDVAHCSDECDASAELERLRLAELAALHCMYCPNRVILSQDWLNTTVCSEECRHDHLASYKFESTARAYERELLLDLICDKHGVKVEKLKPGWVVWNDERAVFTTSTGKWYRWGMLIDFCVVYGAYPNHHYGRYEY